MPRAGHPDHFEVVNGPEDGTQFPVTRTPLEIGSDAGCAVHLQFDRNVKRFQARVTVVSDGYRIRRKMSAATYVDGKRVGPIRSRIARSGSIVQVGDTQIAIQCSPDGLARRSHGLPTENDISWALRILFRFLFKALTSPWAFLRRFLGKYFWILILLVIALLATAYFWPGYISYGLRWLTHTWYWLRAQIPIR